MVNAPEFSIVISSRAQKEILSSWDWYEDQQKGLGDRFVDRILSKMNDIELNPELYPAKYKSYREARITSFPFLVIFRINKRKKSIRIVSIFHTSRNPAKKY